MRVINYRLRPFAALGLLFGFCLPSSSQATPAGVICDYNNNGVCDAADYVVWRDGGPLQNEGDNPGVVNQADYEFWRARFGNTSGSGASVIITPEPSTLLLTVAALAVLGVRRRKMLSAIQGNQPFNRGLPRRKVFVIA